MNADVKMTLNNSYHVELIDSITGKVRKEGTFHNIVTKNIAQVITGTANNASEESTGWGNITGILTAIIVGNGTVQPTYEDTAVTSELWRNRSAESTTFEWLDDYTGRGTVVFSFPATSSYVGTVTEVGLYYEGRGAYAAADVRYAGMATHALFTDSEGSPISFDKTDTDILKITIAVECSLRSATAYFEIFKKPFLIPSLLLGTGLIVPNYHQLIYRYGKLNLCRYYSDLNIFQMYNATNMSKLSEVMDVAVSESLVGLNSAEESYMRYPVSRLLSTNITSETYFKAIAVPIIGYWKLPNESIFPAYKISGINLGVGDGSTKSFENPLGYFKKDTDKVYKNGALLTRGTDYTISNAGNKDCMPELSELNMPVRVYSDAPKRTNTSLKPFILASTLKNSTLSYVSGSYTNCFNAASPLYIEYSEPVTLNCLKSTAGLLYDTSSSGLRDLPIGTTLYVDASVDGVTYEEVASIVTVNAGGNFTLDFLDTTAKYWRIRTSLTQDVVLYNNESEARYFTLNRKDPYIVFTEAPAEGDILTMDVEMDLIMKNSNFVIDLGCKINFTV